MQKRKAQTLAHQGPKEKGKEQTGRYTKGKKFEAERTGSGLSNVKKEGMKRSKKRWDDDTRETSKLEHSSYVAPVCK